MFHCLAARNDRVTDPRCWRVPADAFTLRNWSQRSKPGWYWIIYTNTRDVFCAAAMVSRYLSGAVYKGETKRLASCISVRLSVNKWRIQWLGSSQWPRGLRLVSESAQLPRLWVRIPPGPWMSVVSGVFSGRGLCDELITRPEESYRLWCVWVWRRNLVNEGAMPHWGRGLLRQIKNNTVTRQRSGTNGLRFPGEAEVFFRVLQSHETSTELSLE